MNTKPSLRCLLLFIAFWMLIGLSNTVRAQTSINSKIQFDRLFSQANQFEKSGDFAHARRLYRQSYQQAVSDKQERYAARAAFKLARISQTVAVNKQGEEKARELKKAERNYHLALKHQPETRAIYNNLAELYRSQGKSKRAEEYYKKALAEKIEIKVHVPATERIETIPAKYKTTSKRVLVREAYERMELVYPEDEFVDETGTEPNDDYKSVPPTMERIMVPAEYRTVTESVKVADEQTRIIRVPAENITKVQSLKSDGREDLYKANLAKLRSDQGNWPEAETLYRELVLSEPQSSKYHRLLMNQFQQSEQNPASYLWLLVKNGQILRAQDSALAALESGRGSASEREEWLMIFAAALAKEHFDPTGFAQSARGQRLVKLTQDTDLADATKQLVTLLNGGNWERNSYSYWQHGSPFKEAPSGIWPRDAFRRVTRSMAKWYATNDKIESAKKCLRMTITFAGDEIDPVAISDLADIHIGLGDIEAVHALLGQYEVRMFEGKGRAYRNSTMEKILEFHSVLGKIYAHAGDNGAPGSITSAQFQLEHAKRVADKLERGNKNDKSAPLFTANLARLLVREYQEQNNDVAAIRVSLDTANRYAEIGDSNTAGRLLKAVKNVNWNQYTEQYPNLGPVIEQQLP